MPHFPHEESSCKDALVDINRIFEKAENCIGQSYVGNGSSDTSGIASPRRIAGW
jgi:hypothetical protein